MPEAAYNEQSELTLALVCIAVLITSGILYVNMRPIANQLLYGRNRTNNSVDHLKASNEEDNQPKNEVSGEAIIRRRRKPKLIINVPPSCIQLKRIDEFDEICRELVITKFSCKPEDILNPSKHKIPKYYYQHSVKNNSTNETQNTIVNCIIAVLLLTSLGAALLEFYRAKLSPSPDNVKKGAKPPLNRKCSLADLTVLKHHRKELVRRESILEHQSEDTNGGGGSMAHQGFKPFPLHRRCSFPASFPSNEVAIAGGGGFSSRRNSRKYSMTGDISRRQSAVTDGSRKLSMVTDEDIWRRGSLVGEDSSPERRHHTRLVHRH